MFDSSFELTNSGKFNFIQIRGCENRKQTKH